MTQKCKGTDPKGQPLLLLGEVDFPDDALHPGVLVQDPHHIADVCVDAFVIALSVGRVTGE